MSDVRCEPFGSITLLRPLSPEGSAWIEDNVDPEAQWFAGAVAVEWRCVPDIVVGMRNDGLEVE